MFCIVNLLTRWLF
jgi:hypothetical protein